MVGVPIRAHWFMFLGIVVLSSLPLYASFGLLEHTFARARLNRVGRAAVSAGLVATAATVVGAGAGTLDVVIWFILLATLSLLAAVATADKSWAVVLLLGGGRSCLTTWSSIPRSATPWAPSVSQMRSSRTSRHGLYSFWSLAPKNLDWRRSNVQYRS